MASSPCRQQEFATGHRGRAPVFGKRVVLREMHRDDLEEMQRWPRYAEPDLQWANLDLRTPGQKELWYRQEIGDPARKRFTIVADGRAIGLLSLRDIDYRRGCATLGIRLSPMEVNRGYGTDAIRAVLAYAFERLRLQRVYLDVAANNYRAQRCYEKCGFRLIGHHCDHRGGLYLDMSIGAQEYARQNEGALPS